MGEAVQRAVRDALVGGTDFGEALMTQMVHAHPTPTAAGEKGNAACAPLTSLCFLGTNKSHCRELPRLLRLGRAQASVCCSRSCPKCW